MKTTFKQIIALVAMLSLTACSTSEPAPSTTPTATPSGSSSTPTTNPGGSGDVVVLEEGKLIMATNAAFPPYEMVADDGGFEGIDVEIAAAIAQSLGLELEVLDMDFSSALIAPKIGKADIVMAGMTVDEERKANMEFTTTYATGVQVVIVKAGGEISSLDDLDGKLIGTQEGTTGYIYASDSVENGGYGEENVLAYQNGATAVQSLIQNKVDCVIIDREPARAYVAANPGLEILETEFAVEEYAIGVAKGNLDLLASINTALEALIEDGTVQAIVESYISAE